MIQTALPETGYLRLSQIIGRKPRIVNPEGKRKKISHEAIPALIPVSKSTWWKGVKDGRFPKPIIISLRITVWRVEDIRRFIESGIVLETSTEVRSPK